MRLKCCTLLLALLLASFNVPALRASELSERGSLNVEECNVNAFPDTLQGLWGKYFVLKLVPFDNNNNFLLDTVSVLHERLFGELDYLNDPSTPERYIALDPEYHRLLLPFTYYNSPVGRISKVEYKPVENFGGKSVTLADGLLPDVMAPFRKHDRVNETIDKVLYQAYLDAPEKLVFTEDGIASVREFVDNIEGEVKTAGANTRRMVRDALVSDPVIAVADGAAVEIHKPNWWTVKGNGSLQFSQHYLSDNWYKGGESNNSFIATFQLSANYNDKEKVQWENLIDAKLGFASTPSDTVHSMLSNTDMLRVYSKLGIQAAKKWYYTLSAEFKTQFVHGYKANNPALISNLLAPADLTVALGMDYKEKAKNFNFSVFFAPLNWTMRYVGDDRVDETVYGLDKGKSVKHNFGSEIQPKLEWNVVKNVVLESRLDYLTSYTWVRVEWENTLNLILNRYLSTKIYVHARYDDSTTPISGKSRFQLNELLSFGINYNW